MSIHKAHGVDKDVPVRECLVDLPPMHPQVTKYNWFHGVVAYVDVVKDDLGQSPYGYDAVRAPTKLPY